MHEKQVVLDRRSSILLLVLKLNFNPFCYFYTVLIVCEVCHAREHCQSCFKCNVLQMEGIDIRFSEEAEGDKVKDDCCPGKPFITFRTEVIGNRYVKLPVESRLC